MSKSEKRIREQVIKVRATEAERDAIKANAMKAGRQEVAAYLRELGLAGHGVPGRSERWAALAELSRLGAELRRVGNNVNQLAHEANAGRFPTAERLDSALTDLRQLGEAVTKMIEEL